MAKKSAGTVAIVTDDPGWHGRVLREALIKQGFDSLFTSLTEASISITKPGNSIVFSGLEDNPPVGVFVRGVPGGSLEQVIFRLNILHMCVKQGIPVFNSPRAIERTVDKAMTSFLLKQAGIPTPDTWICESLLQAQKVYQQQTKDGQQLVLKPLFGSQGIGVQKLANIPESDLLNEYGGVFYLQRFISPAREVFQDIRVFVIDGKAITGMTRSHHEWITNRAQGAQCKQLVLTDTIRQMAEAAVKSCNIEYAGVDLILDESGCLQVLEVNSIPAWWGLQKVTDIDIARALIDSFVRRIKQSSGRSFLAND